MRCLVGSFLLSLLLFDSTWAGNLKIVGGDVVWPSLSQPSPTFYVMIFNEQGVTNRLASWQLRLEITSVGETTGVFQFASADIPRDENYILFGDSSLLNGTPEPPPTPLISGPMENITLLDYSLSGIGREVPPSGKTLMKLDFSASGGTQGIFAITAVPGGNSFWTSSENPFIPLGFDNVPLNASDPVIIGYVKVELIPEPHVFFLLLNAALTLACGFCFHKKTDGCVTISQQAENVQ